MTGLASWRGAAWGLLLLASGGLASLPCGAMAETLIEPNPSEAEAPVRPSKRAPDLPPLAERLPKEPLVVDLRARGREPGQPGGEIVTLIGRARDVRFLSTYSYTRLVGYDEHLSLKPDLLAALDIEEGRTFTLRLREGHRWSDGHPFTADDLRYWWEDVALNRDLSPSGPPDFMLVDGAPPRFEVLDARTVRFSWAKPNARFLPTLAGARDPYIYRPAHHLRRFHARYADRAELDEAVRRERVKGWAALHNRLDDMNEQVAGLPTLQPWRPVTVGQASRFVFERNPYYHRVDTAGQQLPYIDRIVMDVASPGLLAAKANAGEADLLFRGLTMADVPMLKEGERAHGYRTLLWPVARGSELALYPNLTVTDPVWRALNRDVRFRRALSLGIDRRTLDNALLFGLGAQGNNTVTPDSPLFRPRMRDLHAGYDPAQASRLLDEIGLTRRNGAGIRLLADGRVLEIVVETDGEGSLVIDGLTLIGEFWREIGVRLFIKPQDRTVLRRRAASGLTVMVAAPGLDNAVPTAIMPPTDLAPLRADAYHWPAWGMARESPGRGEPVDMPEARRLLDLYARWASTSDEAEKAAAWQEMLLSHAENQWTIGTVAGAVQPVVVRAHLRNLPDVALYSWEPTAFVGVYRLDEVFWEAPPPKQAAAR